MKACVIGLALLWGIAAHAQQPAPTKTTELQARSYILSAFVTGAAPLIMAPSTTLTPALRERLKLEPGADARKAYDAMVDVTSAGTLTVRTARPEEIVKAGGKSEFRKPLYAIQASGSVFVVQYDLDADNIIFAGDASGEPVAPAPMATETPVEKPVPPPAPVTQEPLPTIAVPVPTPPAPAPAPMAAPAPVAPPPPPPVVVAPPPPPPPPVVAAPPPPPPVVVAPPPPPPPAAVVVAPPVVAAPPAPIPAPKPAPKQTIASPAPSPAPAPSAAALRPTGPCVVKPVMSEQDLANCAVRDSRRAAAPKEAPKPQVAAAASAPAIAPEPRQCVIKPVMSEEDIAACAKRGPPAPLPTGPLVSTPPAAASQAAALTAPTPPPTCVIKPVMSEEDMAVCAKRGPPAPLPKGPVASTPQAEAPQAAALTAPPAPRTCVIKPVMSEEDLALCAKRGPPAPLPVEPIASKPQAAAPAQTEPPAVRQCVIKPVMSEEDLAACRR